MGKNNRGFGTEALENSLAIGTGEKRDARFWNGRDFPRADLERFPGKLSTISPFRAVSGKKKEPLALQPRFSDPLHAVHAMTGKKEDAFNSGLAGRASRLLDWDCIQLRHQQLMDIWGARLPA